MSATAVCGRTRRAFESNWRQDVGFWWYEMLNRAGIDYDVLVVGYSSRFARVTFNPCNDERFEAELRVDAFGPLGIARVHRDAPGALERRGLALQASGINVLAKNDLFNR